MPISEEEFIKIRNTDLEKNLFSIDNLIDKSDRTLLFGYDLERNTVHVYVRDGLIHYYCYDYPGNTIHYSNGSFELSELIPCKRSYPESTDPEFLKILLMAGVSGNFTTYGEKRYEKIKDLIYQGERYKG